VHLTTLEEKPWQQASCQAKGGGKRFEVDEGNVVEVTLNNLPEDEQRRVKEEMKRELEELEAIRMRKKLACYQKIRSSVVQKVDTTKAMSSKVSTSSLSPEDLVHLVDVSVGSKYGSDLAQLTWALAEDVRSTMIRLGTIWMIICLGRFEL
jgi:hypothetical protein